MDFFSLLVSLLVDLSRLQIVWLFLTFAVLLPASLTLKVPNFLPFLNDLVKYGKVRSLPMEKYNNNNNTLIRYIEVPKK
uniref:Uncharacterized protein n=1 Tax=Romanomermis culicivorax TaxID=13658 RepID=A0A915IYS8_ROMCU